MMHKHVCPICNTEFNGVKKRKYCSRKCQKSDTNALDYCLSCGEEYRYIKSIRRRGGLSGLFCSQECVNDYRIGNKNPNWRGWHTLNYGPGWPKIKNRIRERDGYKCLYCSLIEVNRSHDVHHIVPYRLFKNNSDDNLITLCFHCHRKEHKEDSRMFEFVKKYNISESAFFVA